MACATGDHDQGRRCSEDALSAFARLGAPYEAAKSREALARCLGALDLPAAAAEPALREGDEPRSLVVAAA